MRLALLAIALTACAVEPTTSTTQQHSAACAGLTVCSADGGDCGGCGAFAAPVARVTDSEPCSTCHSAVTPNCMTCHLDFDHSQTVDDIWTTKFVGR